MSGPWTIKAVNGRVCFRDLAQEIEARQGRDRETGLDAKHESPVAERCAQKDQPA